MGIVTPESLLMNAFWAYVAARNEALRLCAHAEVAF